MVVSSGRMRSNVERSQPAKMEILPVSARWQPPETGQSTGSPPRARTFSPSRRTSASSVVDISIQIFPGPIAESSPSSASSTSADAAGVGRQVMAASQDSIIRAGLSPHSAPAARNGCAVSRSRSRTVTSSPLRSSEPASLPPTLPSPMKPIFMRAPLIWVDSSAAYRRRGPARRPWRPDPSTQRVGQRRVHNPAVLRQQRRAEYPRGGDENAIGRIAMERIGQRRHVRRNGGGDTVPVAPAEAPLPCRATPATVAQGEYDRDCAASPLPRAKCRTPATATRGLAEPTTSRCAGDSRLRSLSHQISTWVSSSAFTARGFPSDPRGPRAQRYPRPR